MKIMTHCDRLRQQVRELDSYARELLNEAYRLEEIGADLSRLEGRGIRQAARAIQQQADRLRRQRQKILLMKRALEKIIDTYERCEQAVENLGEQKRRGSPGTIRVKDFSNIIMYMKDSGIHFLR